MEGNKNDNTLSQFMIHIYTAGLCGGGLKHHTNLFRAYLAITFRFGNTGVVVISHALIVMSLETWVYCT